MVFGTSLSRCHYCGKSYITGCVISWDCENDFMGDMKPRECKKAIDKFDRQVKQVNQQKPE